MYERVKFDFDLLQRMVEDRIHRNGGRCPTACPMKTITEEGWLGSPFDVTGYYKGLSTLFGNITYDSQHLTIVMYRIWFRCTCGSN
jgi:hypothetical protein